MNIYKLFDEIRTMVLSDNIAEIAHSYVEVLTDLESLYKDRVNEICNRKEEDNEE